MGLISRVSSRTYRNHHIHKPALTNNMLLLFESASGYGLFKVNKESDISEVDDVQKLLGSCDADQASKYLSLQKFQPIRDTAEALQCATALNESKISKPLKKLLKKVDASEELCVADAKLGQLIKEKFSIQCVFNRRTEELMRVVREHLTELASNSITNDEAAGMALGLAHSLSRYKLKFSPDKVDTMIVQAISLLDDLDKELNNMMMRMREWYGWHFPEMTKIITDNLAYARVVRQMGLRKNAKETDFSGVLPEEIEEQLKDAAELSMGCEISEEDLLTVFHLADRVIELSEYRAKLYEYLKNRMEAIAPNLTMLVGELVGARLIAHAGSLVNLAKHPASTIQVLGAEKALFRALKTKKDTPKYGLIYHASLVGQSSAKNKGRMSRMLAAKAALALRYDAFGDADESTVELGINNRAKLERRLKVLETGKVEKSPFKKEKKKEAKGAFAVKSETMEYDEAADSTLKRKQEEVKAEPEEEEAAAEEPPKKKSKKNKKKKEAKEEASEEATEEPSADAAPTEVVAEVSSTSPEKKKKKKKKAKQADEDGADLDVTAQIEEAAGQVEEMAVTEEGESESPKKKKKKKKA